MSDINKKFVSINYTNRDFNSLRAELVNYAKRYYPDTFSDFTESSFASLLIDTVAYTGDMLSFYLDYQFNESLLATANDYNNVLKLAKQFGYKYSGTQAAYGRVAIYAIIPANSLTAGPNTKYMPIIKRGTVLASENGVSFTLTDDVTFSESKNEVVVYTTDSSTGLPTQYAVKAYGNVVSGLYEVAYIRVNGFEKFRRIVLNEPNITEIISVTDSEGFEYFEVDYLSQDVVYQTEINNDPSTNQQTPNLIIPKPAARRFVIEKTFTTTELVFGQTSKTNVVNKYELEPSNIAVQRHGRNYVSDKIFDPNNLISSDQFGIAPENTTLTIIYKKNNDSTVNVSTNSLTRVVTPIVDFQDPISLNRGTVSTLVSTLECNNEEPIYSNSTVPTLREIKQQAMGSYSAQSRAVTSQDYESICYQLPSGFGSLLRVRAVKDNDSLKRNINLYVLSGDSSRKFQPTNAKTKQNLKNWINNYRMLNDSIDILNGKVVNFGITFTIVVQEMYNKYAVIDDCLTKLREEIGNKVYYIGESIKIMDVYTMLNKVNGVSDVINVSIISKNGIGYSSDSMILDRYKTPDGRKIVPPENVAFEVKFPLTDIVGNAV